MPIGERRPRIEHKDKPKLENESMRKKEGAASGDKELTGEKMETDVTAAWNKLTYGLALETKPQEMKSAKQELLKIIKENKKRNPMERIDNENYFARDLMGWIKDRSAEGEEKKGRIYL